MSLWHRFWLGSSLPSPAALLALLLTGAGMPDLARVTTTCWVKAGVVFRLLSPRPSSCSLALNTAPQRKEFLGCDPICWLVDMEVPLGENPWFALTSAPHQHAKSTRMALCHWWLAFCLHSSVQQASGLCCRLMPDFAFLCVYYFSSLVLSNLSGSGPPRKVATFSTMFYFFS